MSMLDVPLVSAALDDPSANLSQLLLLKFLLSLTPLVVQFSKIGTESPFGLDFF